MIIIIIRIWTTETNGDIKKQRVWRDLSYWSLVSPGQRWTGRRWDPPDVWCLFLSCCNSFRLQHVRCARSPPGGRTWNHKHMTLTLVKLTDATWLILQVTCLLTGTSLCSDVQLYKSEPTRTSRGTHPHLGLLRSPWWHRKCRAESGPPSSKVTSGTAVFSTPEIKESLKQEGAFYL